MERQSICSVTEGWLPVVLGGRYHSARWMRVGPSELSEPFFDAATRILRQRHSPPELETSLETLVEVIAEIRPSEPCGVIVHMSRCGSTLLVNQLRNADSVVCMAEPQPFDAACDWARSDSAWWSARGKTLMKGLVGAYGAYHGGDARRVVVKCGITGALAIRVIRDLWPGVPVVVLIRDPVEVVVSNLKQPPRWLLAWFRFPESCPFGMPPTEALSQLQEFCAWIVGRICETILSAGESVGAIIRYEDLTLERILGVADTFGLRFSVEGEDSFRACFSRDAKDSRKTFSNDAARKQQTASPTLRDSVERWATGPYLALRHRKTPTLIRKVI